ncbi:MAG: LysR family transcriptional regulator [Ilumatobacteraceae bacterium]
MRAPIPSLIDLEAFEAAARHGSFVAAAGELHLTPSAISHRVRSLERQLGVVLFTRHARRIELTDHGRSYMPSVRQAFDELAVSTAGLFGFVRPARRLTARVPISYAVMVVAPRLHEFKQLHPDIELRIVSAIWADSLATEDVDLDVRFGAGTWTGHQAELLHSETATAVVAPAFSDRVTPIDDVAELAKHPRVHVLGMENLWFELLGASAAGLTNVDVTVDTSLAAIELACSGACSAIVPTRFVARHLADGRLCAVAHGSVAMSQAHYIVQPSSVTALSAEAKLFADWLRSLDG